MSKHNYSKYSSNKNNNVEIGDSVSFENVDVVENVSGMPELELSTPVAEPIVETVETVTLPETVNGVVANCTKLNIRMKPDTDGTVVCVLEAGSEIKINVSESNNDWLSVCTATGIEGYCMRKFVNANL